MTSSASLPAVSHDDSTPVRAAIAAAAERRGNARFSVVELEVEPGHAEHLLELDANAYYFAQPDGSVHAGCGALAVLTGEGPGRFAQLSAALQQFFANLSDAGSGLRLYGGFAFQPARAASPAWRGFGEARFVVPRLAYAQTGERALLRLLLEASELDDRAAQERSIRLLERARTELARAPSPDRAVLVEHPAQPAHDERFVEQVRAIQREIASGALEKLVLARCLQVSLERPGRAAQVLTRLAAIAPECTRFAFSAQGSTFLGATPERLVTKTGQRFRTEAVAGSIQAGDSPAGRLMESSKDRAEHAIVVREVLRALEPLTSSLTHDQLPEIHRLRHVAHLRTQIEGELKAPTHVLSLVERLHPTPAVGGVPSARALAWIAEHEPVERGWYAGPIGWVDSRGDGAFVVALRSGVLHEREALLYSGAGIVQGSDPERELAETRWKLEALLGALGAAP